MNFDPIKGVIQITPEEAKRATEYLLYAIRKVKQSAGIPLVRCKRDDTLTDADHAMHGIIEGAQALGIDLGARWGNEIDSTNHS